MAKFIKGVNDLATIRPDLADEWHPNKNDDLTPENISVSSHENVWWLFPYDDPVTGKHFDFEWQAPVYSRKNGNNCPYISGRKVWVGFNDLATVNPKLAKQWNYEKNGNLKPTDVTVNCHAKVWWKMPYIDPRTGILHNFEWPAKISDRNRGDDCPYLSGHSVWKGYNDLASTNPELTKEWHPTKNGKLTPTDVTANSHTKVWWQILHFDSRTGKVIPLEWQAKIDDRNNGNGCPYLNGTKILKGFNDLATINPELAKEWHPTKNGKLTPKDVTTGSNKKVWWRIKYSNPKTGEVEEYEWPARIADRNKGVGCPYTATPKIVALINELFAKNNIKYISEKKFDNLKDKKILPFDFFVNDCLIEVDGWQHFKVIKHYGGKENFKTRVKHDNMKNQYCCDNNIPLLRIPYAYDPIVDKEKIEQFVLNFITTGEVPQEIVDFYAQYEFSNYATCVKSRKLTEVA